MTRDWKTDEGELVIRNGDLVIYDSSQNHMEDILNSNYGEWKHNPEIAVRLTDYISSPSPLAQVECEQKCKQQLFNDGFDTRDFAIKFSNGKAYVECNGNRFR